MNKRELMMLRVLVNRFNPKSGNALLKFLPQEEVEEVTALNIRSTDLTPIFAQPAKSLARIHYTWIQPLLNKFPDRLQPFVAAALTAEQIAGLKASPAMAPSHFAKSFIQNKLYELLNIGDHLPIEYLPETELSPLAKLPKQQIVNLIDFLGLHDLAAEVRRIVNPNYLKTIYSCLTPKENKFLKMCLNQKEQITSPKLRIDPNKVDCTKLKQVLHRRGLNRLGKALSGQHEDLIWHIAHILDSGRGKILLKETLPMELGKVTPLLRQQVLNLLHYLKSESM